MPVFPDARRREFLGVISDAAAVWLLAARSQQPAMPVIGFLGTASPDGYVPLVDGFRRGLRRSSGATPRLGLSCRQLRSDRNALGVMKQVVGVISLLHGGKSGQACTPIGVRKILQIEIAVVHVGGAR